MPKLALPKVPKSAWQVHPAHALFRKVWTDIYAQCREQYIEVLKFSKSLDRLHIRTSGLQEKVLFHDPGLALNMPFVVGRFPFTIIAKRS
jgi:hypothetical protein